MINLYKNQVNRSKSKTLFSANKSHIASMNLRIPYELIAQTNVKQSMKGSYRPEEDKPRSTHKYKKSLVLHDNTVQLIKKNSDYYPQKSKEGMSTQRLSKQKTHKKSVDYGITRLKTQVDEFKKPESAVMVEMSVQQIKQIAKKLSQLRSQKQNLKKQINLYKNQVKKNGFPNGVLKALGI